MHKTRRDGNGEYHIWDFRPQIGYFSGDALEEKVGREHGKDGMNGTNGKKRGKAQHPFRLFRYFRLFRTLSSYFLNAIAFKPQTAIPRLFYYQTVSVTVKGARYLRRNM